MKKSLHLLLITAILFLASCRKDPLTKPVKVDFQFGLSAFVMEDGVGGLETGGADKSSTLPGQTGNNPLSGNGPLRMDNGTLVIASIDFEGRREQGEDVFFTYTPPQPIVADLGSETTNLPVSFDIPQGIYTRIELTLYLGTDELAPLVLNGVLNRGPFSSLPVRFDYRFTEEIRVRGQGRHQQNIVLSEDKQSVGRVELDVESVFRLVNMGMVMNASAVDIGGQNIILIDNSNNLPIFNMIANRLGNAFSLVID
jgi:hypothetical protein